MQLERDPHTGHLTTGHEWNGIKELNRPVPKAIWIFLVSAALFAFVYWVLMPAWPLGRSYTRGLLGIDQRTTVAESLQRAEAARADWTGAIEQGDFAAIRDDAALMQRVRDSGRALFGDNCAVCHGSEGQGAHGFPRLTDGAWLWGGDPEAVAETIRVGINAGHAETRFGEMPAFGRDQVLDRQAIGDVVSYVRSLGGDEPAATAVGEEAASRAAGAELFAANCAACHGDDGRGSTEMGAPDLTDGFWIYGGDRAAVYTTVFGGRQGHMPHWEDRLSPVQRKILALYILDLGEAGKASQ